MRALLIVTVCFFAACGLPKKEEVIPQPMVPEALSPNAYVTELKVAQYFEADGGLDVTGVGPTNFEYALGDGVPTMLTMAPHDVALMIAGDCRHYERGVSTWTRVVSIEGTSATLELQRNQLAITLREPGVTKVTIAGSLDGVHCNVNGAELTTMGTLQTIVFTVRQIDGYELRPGSGLRYQCDGKIVPSDRAIPVPTLMPFDSKGAFTAANAPVPVHLKVSGANGFSLEQRELVANAGTISVKPMTELPVRGLTQFEVVGPEAVTSITAELVLIREGSKGSLYDVIKDDMAYPIFDSSGVNGVVLRQLEAATAGGRLCATPPAKWFVPTSLTPMTCVASPMIPDDFTGEFIAAIVAGGECRIETRLRGTDFSWTTRFSTR